jgi:hypothetical protein
MKSTATKKQHYVPQFYLRQWCDSDGCFYPVKIENKKPPKLVIFKKKSRPSCFCFENFFYAQHTGKEDEMSQLLEESFADIEGDFSKHLSRIEKDIVDNKQVSDDEKYLVSQFMTFLWMRGKSWLDQSKKMSEDVAKQIFKMDVYNVDKIPKLKAKMEKLGLTKEDMIKFAEEEKYTIDFGNAHHLMLLKEMDGFSNLLHAKVWKIYISKKGEFVTSDAPYLDMSTNKGYWGNDFLSREQSFVLSPRVLIVALYPSYDGGKKIFRKDITEDVLLIRQINCHNLMNSMKFGFHKDRKILEDLERYISLVYESKRPRLLPPDMRKFLV